MKSSIRQILTLTAAALVIALLASSSRAQTNFLGGLHFNAGFPQGEFKNQINRDAYGIGGQFFFSPQKGPLAIGIEFGWMNYGTETRREPFSGTIPDVTVEVETSNNIVQSFFVLRGRIPDGPIQLYVDAIVGLNYLFTETKIKDEDSPSDEIASSTNFDDAAFAYGFGGGIMVPVYTRQGEMRHDRPIQILLDCGVRYVYGGEAEYLKEGSIERQGSVLVFDTMKSKTDMMRLHAGLLIRF